MKFVQLHKPLGTSVLLNLDNVDHFELDSQDVGAVANMTNGDRIALAEKLDEIEAICGVAVAIEAVRNPMSNCCP